MNLMLIIFFVGVLILISGTFFSEFKKIFITEPFLSIVIAILLGPEILGVIELDITSSLPVLKKTSEFTIAMALMATALRIPKSFFRRNFQTQTFLVIGGMLLMWLSGSFLLYLVFNLSIAECLLLGAIITPTDPVVASTIVTGKLAEKYLPSSIRNSLSFEAGVNDGLAFPLVFAGIFLVQADSFPIGKWIVEVLLFKTILCAVIAYITGYGAGLLMHKANIKGYMNKKSFLPFSLALSFVLLEGLNLLNMNGIIAVFIGGLAFSRVISENEDVQEERVQEAMERIFTIPAYFLLGLVLPWQEYVALGWKAIGIVVLVILFRRIPGFFALGPFMPKFKKRKKDLLFMGWFGPIGVAAIYYALHTKEQLAMESAWVIPSLIVVASTIIHGISSVPFQKWYHSLKNDH